MDAQSPVEDALRPLPEPDSAELRSILTGVHAAIYGLLYRRRSDPPTMIEIREFVADELGEAQSQTDRRVRDLYAHFDIEKVRLGRDPRYLLRGWSKRKRPSIDTVISNRVRAEVFASGRCAMCGRTPLSHGVVLHVDHKVPRAWGGGNEPENLQPLCEDCNTGKKDHFSSFDAHADRIKQAIGHEEPHRRIGELLKAFDGEWVSGSLLEIVASAQQYQEDWQKRTRELRVIGWIIETQKRQNEGGRVRTYYRATHWEPWPEGPIGAAIRRRERAARAARRGTAPEASDSA
jgi:hypothetical protein